MVCIIGGDFYNLLLHLVVIANPVPAGCPANSVDLIILAHTARYQSEFSNINKHP